MEKLNKEEMTEVVDAIQTDMEDLVEHREELAVIAGFDKNLAARLTGVFDAADAVLEYMEARNG